MNRKSLSKSSNRSWNGDRGILKSINKSIRLVWKAMSPFCPSVSHCCMNTETCILSARSWRKYGANGLTSKKPMNTNQSIWENRLSSNVVGMTCNRVGAYSFQTSLEMFDVAIIDEVCKATLPEILMPLCISHKAILVGDPKQLPPVFCKDDREIIR